MRPDQQPMQYCSSFEGVYVSDQAVLLLPCWKNNHCLRPGLNVVIKTLLALLPTASIDKAFLVIGMQLSIGKIIKRRHNSITLFSQLIEPITIFVTGGRNCATLI